MKHFFILNLLSLLTKMSQLETLATINVNTIQFLLLLLALTAFGAKIYEKLFAFTGTRSLLTIHILCSVVTSL